MQDGRTAKVGTFIQMSGGGGPDGLALDEQGNLADAHAGKRAVWVFDPTGEPLYRVTSCAGHITTNVAFGGSANTDLFITESESITTLRAKLPIPVCACFLTAKYGYPGIEGTLHSAAVRQNATALHFSICNAVLKCYGRI